MKTIYLAILLLLSTAVSAQTMDDLYASTDRPVTPAKLVLNWTIPTARENGDVLEDGDLSGYQIYLIPPTGEQEVIPVNDPLATSHDLMLSEPGEYLISIAAVDSNKLKSARSETVSADIVAPSPPNMPGSITVKVVCEKGSNCTFYLVK